MYTTSAHYIVASHNISGIFDSKKANHVLVNEYLPGQGIMPHFDGSLFYPTITTISCGSHTILEFYGPDDGVHGSGSSNTDTVDLQPASKRNVAFKLLVERRSLLILKDDMYERYMHGIAEVETDTITDDIKNLFQCCDTRSYGEKVPREKRVSLTIRHVPKTSKMTLRF